ncbi:MAG: phage portal protein [Clostridiales bacterium]|nr:phage portal protein [Clostridiales bacterium]HOA33052.1 serine/threonine protein phosphatase [Clostridiales bacterium]HOJ35378.1 serine/threonine protein phosphatase [Clostridiales bacterium]HOL78827.1 serine/threonine protein phosphatase [Clostridiales bacterium]HPP67689.1 serine/threonine protein phosphatase [Clostridiales bacterium]
MGLFSKKEKPSASAVSSPQTRQAGQSSFFDDYKSMYSFHGDISLYKTLRESVPIIDAGIRKLARLIGSFEVRCDDSFAQREIRDFLQNVVVDGSSRGINSFVYAYFEQLLTYGTAVAEILPSKGSPRDMSLYRADLRDIVLMRDKNDSSKTLVCVSRGSEPVPVKHQELILLSVLNPEAGSLNGNSILKGLPFISSVLMKIYNTIGLNFERVGNVRYAVTYRPKEGSADKLYAKERAMQIASEWSAAMQSGSEIKDFIAVGDVDIKVIGADNQILDSEVPVRQMLEQIVAKLGLPPFMLGLNWSTTERMAAQQTDILTSELEFYRKLLTPVIGRIISTFMRFNGLKGGFEILWDEISMQDEVELSKARLNNAKALEVERRLGAAPDSQKEVSD